MTTEIRARDALKRFGFKFNKSLGQNFLLNDDVIEQIVDRADVREGENVVEIGAGAGVLTACLARRGANVAAIEIDKNLEPVLDAVLAGLDARIVVADALKCDIAGLFDGVSFRVIANLPYYITTDALMRLTNIDSITSITVLVQTEAAGRIMADIGEEGYCALSAVVKMFGIAEKLMDIPSQAFTPPPHVQSTLLRIDRRSDYSYSAECARAMREAIRIAFAMRRKTLVNNLSASLSMPKQEAKGILESVGLDQNVRGETLSIEDFENIAQALVKRNFL